VIVPKTQPLVLTAQAPAAQASTSPAPATDPWNATASVTADPPSSPIYLIDKVDLGPTGAAQTDIYSVRAMDVFGRLSAAAFSAAVDIGENPPPAPINLAASLTSQADPHQPTSVSTVQVSWNWPPDPAFGTLSDLQGFNLYSGPVVPTRTWVDGSIQSVAESAAGDPPVPNNLPVFHVATDLPSAGIDSTALPMLSVRAGADTYVVCDGTVSAQSTLALRLYVNLSNQTGRPSVGDDIRLFNGTPNPNLLQQPAAYANVSSLPNTGLQADMELYLTAATGELSWPPADENGISKLMIGISAFNAGGESPIAGPVVVRYINTASTPPPVPTSQSETDQYTGPADVSGHCEYAYPAWVLPAGNYHVCRTFDQRLLSALQRAPAGSLSAPTAYAAPLTPADFTAASTTSLPVDPESLSNLQLHAIANLVGLESAFEQITATPISIPANSNNPSTPFSQTYLDGALPGGGTNRYLYRLRSVSLNGALGAWGWVSPPVRLYPTPPVRPLIGSVRVSAFLATILWNPNPEAQVDRYRLYQTTDPNAAGDERSMRLVAEILATDAAQVGTEGLLGASVSIPQGNTSWFRLVAVATWSAPVGPVPSAPSDPVRLVSQSSENATPPLSAVVARVTIPGGSQVTVTFTPSTNPTTQFQLWRKPAGGAAAVPVTGWVANPTPAAPATLSLPAPANSAIPPAVSAVLVDANPLSASVKVAYQVAARNEQGTVTFSLDFPL
jgi:hypothetical protein